MLLPYSRCSVLNIGYDKEKRTVTFNHEDTRRLFSSGVKKADIPAIVFEIFQKIYFTPYILYTKFREWTSSSKTTARFEKIIKKYTFYTFSQKSAKKHIFSGFAWSVCRGPQILVEKSGLNSLFKKRANCTPKPGTEKKCSKTKSRTDPHFRTLFLRRAKCA